MKTPPVRVLGVAAFVLLAALLYASTASRFEPLVLEISHGPYGTDTGSTSRAMCRLNYQWKHPLFSPVTFPLTKLAEWVGGETAAAVVFVVVLLAVANVAATLLLLQQLTGLFALAVAGALAYAVFFSNLVIFSLPETYSLSSLAILAYLYALARTRAPDDLPSARGLGALAGVASLCSLPLLSLAGILAVRCVLELGWRAALRPVLHSTAVALPIWLLPNLVVQGVKRGDLLGFFQRSAEYGESYASGSNLVSPDAVATTVLGFLSYSVAPPIRALGSTIPAAAVRDFPDHPLALLAAIAFGVLLLVAFVSRIRARDSLAIGVGLWLAGTLVFYAYFNPREAILYSPQVLFPCLMVIALAARSAPRWWLAGLALLAASAAAHNVPLVLEGAWAFTELNVR